MPATVLDGKALAARIRGELKLETERLAAEGIAPGLAVVLVGEDPASQIYVRNKTTACAQAGIKTFDHRLPATTSTGELLSLVASLNADPLVDGILIQLPLPAGIDARRVLFAVDPGKDVDGIHPENVGRLLMAVGKCFDATIQMDATNAWINGFEIVRRLDSAAALTEM